MSDETEWAKIGASLLGGGLAGAILTNIITVYRSRVQPIGRSVVVSPLFTAGFTGSALSPTVTVTSASATHQFPNLHVAEVQVVNRGNRDFDTFSFGLTLATGDQAVHVDPVTSDRHHTVTIDPLIAPDKMQSKSDFTLRPFNRRDAYTLRVFIVAGNSMPGAISVSSPEPIRFTDIPSLTETIAQIASSTSFPLGPFILRLSTR